VSAGQAATIVQDVELSAAFWLDAERLLGLLSDAERVEISDTLSAFASMVNEPQLTLAGVRDELARLSGLDDDGLVSAYARHLSEGAIAEIDRARHKMGTLSSGDVASLRGGLRRAMDDLPPAKRGAMSKAGRLDFAKFVEGLADKRRLARYVNKENHGSPRVRLARLLLAAAEGRKRPQSLDVAHAMLRRARKLRKQAEKLMEARDEASRQGVAPPQSQ